MLHDICVGVSLAVFGAYLACCARDAWRMWRERREGLRAGREWEERRKEKETT